MFYTEKPVLLERNAEYGLTFVIPKR